MSKPWEVVAAGRASPIAPEVEPLTQGAAVASQAAAQGAVTEAVVNPNPSTSTVMGALQGAAQTTPGALVTTGATTGGSAILGGLTDLQELPSVAWITTWIYQGVKHHHLVDQDKHKWYWLLGISAVAAFLTVFAMSHGDLWVSAAHVFRCCGPAAYQSSLNYSLAKPLGIFSSAADVVKA